MSRFVGTVAVRTRSALYIKFCVFEFAFWLLDFGKEIDGDHVALVLLLDQIEVFSMTSMLY